METGTRKKDHHGMPAETLSVKDALLWFSITVAALCLAGTSNAGASQNESAVTTVER